MLIFTLRRTELHIGAAGYKYLSTVLAQFQRRVFIRYHIYTAKSESVFCESSLKWLLSPCGYSGQTAHTFLVTIQHPIRKTACTVIPDI